MPRHSKTCATVVVCAGFGGRAEAKDSMFEEICGTPGAREQGSLSERSIYTSDIIPSTVGYVSWPFRRPIRAYRLAWPWPSRVPFRPRYVCTVNMCNCEVV